MRTNRQEITFSHPFTLAGLDGLQPAGKYLVVTGEEEIPGLSFVAWKRVATLIHLPAMGISSAMQQVVTIQPQDLAAAQTRDGNRDQPYDNAFLDICGVRVSNIFSASRL